MLHWENNFAIYASNNEVQNQATVYKPAGMEKTSGLMYDVKDGRFRKLKGLETDMYPSTYDVKNSPEDD